MGKEDEPAGDECIGPGAKKGKREQGGMGTIKLQLGDK